MAPHPGPPFRLPLFPLPVVLVPTAVMPLHIFEPRYRRMVARCLEYDRRFGLFYHDSDVDGPFLFEEGRVGCVAEIETFEPLPDGRSLLVVRGRERVQILDGIESEEPYYEALVAEYADAEPTGSPDLLQQRQASLALFEAVLGSLPQRPEQLPEMDPGQELSFPLLRTVEGAPTWHQALLEVRSEGHRLAELERVFRAALQG